MTILRTDTEFGAFHFLAEDAYIGQRLAHGVAWERDVLLFVRRLLPAAGPCHVVDVGAHVGTHTIPYARWLRGRGHVSAFEPQAMMEKLLRRNIQDNDCLAEVSVFPFAVGHSNGIEVSLEDVIRDGPNAHCAFTYADGLLFNYGGLQLGVGSRKVIMRTLDSFPFAHVGLLKVDAEGAEPLVFWGARELIRRDRPILVFERNQKAVTDSMRAVVDIPEEVSQFRIEEFVLSLGYASPISLPGEQLVLLPSSRS